MAPSKDKEHKLKEYKDDSPVKLDPTEKFLKAMFDIPFSILMLKILEFENTS